MDVVALAQAGFTEAAAPMGTALTEDQLRLAWRAAPEPILCFDGDAAGLRAANRAAVRALPLLEPGRSLRFAMLPQGQDPDDLVSSAGSAAFEKLLSDAETLIDHLWRSETEGVDTGTPERRAAVRQRLYGHAAEIADGSVQQLYRAEFKARFDRLFAPRRQLPGRYAPGRYAPGRRTYGEQRFGSAVAGASPSIKQAARRSPYDREITAILAGLLANPSFADSEGEAVAGLEIADPALARLRSAIFRAVAADPALDKDQLRADLDRRGLGSLAEEVSARNWLTFSFNRCRTPAADAAEKNAAAAANEETARAAEDLACVAEHLIALARIESEQAGIRAREDWLTQEEYDHRTYLTREKQRLETNLAELAHGRRTAAEGL